MVRSRNDSYSEYFGRAAPYLHPSSDSFGTTDGRAIRRSFVVVGGSLYQTLLSLTTDLANGSIGVQRYTNRARGAIRGAYYTAYSLGAISIFPFYTLTDRDVQLLDRELNEETRFLSAFAREVRRNKLVLTPARRITLYVLGLRGIFERGRVEAMPRGPYRWTLGINEHCTECLLASRNGPYQRDLYSGLGLPELPGIPGDGSVCLGLTRCGCRIELASGIPLPNEELADHLREVLLEVVNADYSAAV